MVIRYTGVVTYNICTHCTPKFYPFTFVGFTLNNLLGGDPFRRVIFKDVARKHFGKNISHDLTFFYSIGIGIINKEKSSLNIIQIIVIDTHHFRNYPK